MIPSSSPSDQRTPSSSAAQSSLSPSDSQLSSSTAIRLSSAELGSLSSGNNGLLSPPANTGLSSSFVSDGGGGSYQSNYLGLTPSSYSSTLVNSYSSAYWDCSDLVSLEGSFRAERGSLCGSSGTLCEEEQARHDYKWDKERKKRSRGYSTDETVGGDRRVSFSEKIALAQIEDDEVEEDTEGEEEPIQEEICEEKVQELLEEKKVEEVPVEEKIVRRRSSVIEPVLESVEEQSEQSEEVIELEEEVEEEEKVLEETISDTPPPGPSSSCRSAVGE